LKSPYDDYPGFYTEDNRQKRVLSPINKEQLENRHAAMFAEWNLAGKSVLDLGSCLGATGQWVLFHGAADYVGVEAQRAYVERSRKLLAHHGSRATIVESEIEAFLDDNQRQFDIVVLLGVIYAFLNYHEVLTRVAAICNENLIIEGVYPYPSVGDPLAPIIEVTSEQSMVIADQERHVQGIGVRLAPAALEIILSTLGFEPAGKHPMPKRIKSVLDNFCGDPRETYFVRYLTSFRKSASVSRLLTDELMAPDEKTRQKNWTDFEKHLPHVAPKTKIVADKQWAFDKHVADKFAEEARQNIPDYERVIDLCVNFAEHFIAKSDPIIDVGCALGETLRRLHLKGFENLAGVDNSSHMLDRVFNTPDRRVTYHLSDTFPQTDVQYGLVTANWTLHFIDRRADYLADIHDAIKPGGFLIMTDKVMLSNQVDALYKTFKRGQGLSEEYIAYKEEALKEILTSYPLDWYLVILRKIGFQSVEIINANLAFTTFLARK